MKRCDIFIVVVLILFLSGCKVDLYKGLTEEDANQMLEILILHNIDADKQSTDTGIILQVEQKQFINAVELLRLHGFPRRQYMTIESMFPSNQLVVSPTAEQQKILFLKEQRLESMLSHMDGVVRADVTIATGESDNSGTAAPVSVAVFIKYSPHINLEAYKLQIKKLIEKSITGLQYGQISILMQPAELQMPVATTQTINRNLTASLREYVSRFSQKLSFSPDYLTAIIGLLLLGVICLWVIIWIRRRR